MGKYTPLLSKHTFCARYPRPHSAEEGAERNFDQLQINLETAATVALVGQSSLQTTLSLSSFAPGFCKGLCLSTAMATQDRLRHVQSLEDQKEKTEQYRKLLAELIAAASEADIKDYVEHSKS